MKRVTHISNVIVLIAVPVYMLAIFALVPLLMTRPVAPLTTFAFVLLGMAALSAVAMWPRSLPTLTRRRRLLAVLVCTPFVMLVLLPTFICACVKVPRIANLQTAREYLALQQGTILPGAERRDTYGGHFHCAADDTETRVWSEGPDLHDDGGAVSVLQDAMRFEAAWNTCYGPPTSILSRIQETIRRMALMEVVNVLGRLRGDLVWRVNENGKLTESE